MSRVIRRIRQKRETRESFDRLDVYTFDERVVAICPEPDERTQNRGSPDVLRTIMMIIFLNV